MDIILYIAILSIGVVFGSFFTLAVYRIPRKEDITHVRSHCTTCNHRLDFWDLIPVFSYIFLGGKCRYCMEKIRPRYFLLEIFSGLVFLCIAISRGLSIDMSLIEFVELGIIYLFVAGTFIIAGIDKERFEIPSSLIIYEFIIGLIYNIFLYAIGKSIISNVIGFIVIPIIFLIINYIIKLLFKDENKLPFGMGDIEYIAVIGLMMGFGAELLTIVVSLLVTSISILVNCLLKKEKKDKIAFGFYLSIAVNIIFVLMPYLKDAIECLEMMI